MFEVSCQTPKQQRKSHCGIVNFDADRIAPIETLNARPARQWPWKKSRVFLTAMLLVCKSQGVRSGVKLARWAMMTMAIGDANAVSAAGTSQDAALVVLLRAENERLKEDLAKIQGNLADSVALNLTNIENCRSIEAICVELAGDS
ncbi:MAG: hypothetical protein WBD31_19325, partial [Rubripirellula sp.]